MANILDYLDWRGDLTLAERGFNEVDNLLMAELCFLDFSGIVPADFSASVSLPEAMQKYDAARPQETMGVLVPEQIPELGHKMAASRRFSDLTLCAYVSRTDEETQTQFSALTALLSDKTAYIAFRGTDDTIVGWKEDFNMAFTCPVPAQRLAARYAASAMLRFPGEFLLGGHSKGGNFAVYAAAFCGDEIQDRIEAVYNYDGPGFDSKVLSEPGYQRICQKIQTFVPQSSVVGMLLGHEEKYTIVHSEQTFLQQHDTYSWEVLQKHFHYLDTVDNSSRFVDYTLKAWLAQMTPAQREQFVDAIYEVMRQTNAHTLHQMNENWLASAASILKSAKNMDEETRQAVTHVAGLLLSSAKDGLLRVVLEQEAGKGE